MVSAGRKRFFSGRLAIYHYWDMPMVIDEPLTFAQRYLAWQQDVRKPRPVFAQDLA